MRGMIGRLRQMLIKEFIQVFRDKRTRFVLLGPPIIQMVIFGYAATLDIRHVPTAILDYDNTQVSRDLISRFAASRYFDVRLHLTDQRQIPGVIDRGEAIVVVRINAGFSRDLEKGGTAHLQVVVDSSNSNTALVGLGYVNEVTGAFAQDYQTARLQRTSPLAISRMPGIVLDQRPWFNSGFSSRWFFIPGVIGNIIMVIVVNLTAFAVVREREIGTLEQIMVTPIRRVEFIMGKTVPFFLIRHSMVWRAFAGQYRCACAGHVAVSCLHARYRSLYLHYLKDTAASDGDRIFLYNAVARFFRLCHSGKQHAEVASVADLTEPAALLPGCAAKRISEGCRTRRPLAADGGYGSIRFNHAYGQRFPLP
jgi:hypothetical protein